MPPRTLSATLGPVIPALFLILGVPASPAVAQGDAPRTPETVADEFQRGFQSMAWAGLVQRIHPQGLAYLRVAADILVQVDSTDYALGTLLGGVEPDAYPALPDGEVVLRMLQGIQEEAPGLLSSLVSRRSTVLGSVEDGESRHVVYRILALVAGAEPRIEVMTLLRDQGRWKVAEAEDLRVLHTAIRGIPIPPGPSRSGRPAPSQDLP